MDPVRRHCLWVLGGLSLVACARPVPTPEPFTIAHVSPSLDAASPPLLLNDAITVYFSADVLPVSVTANTVTLVDDQEQVVPGTLRVGSNWVTYHPTPPVTRDLDDGSYRLGARYRLSIAGSPRPDAVRSVDGRRLAAATVFPVRIARFEEKPPELPAPLRPMGNDILFFLRSPDGIQQLPADSPRLQLHFTQPLLPSSVTPEAFEITSFRSLPGETLVPRSVRVLRRSAVFARLADEPPGCSVEIDLGSLPLRAGSGVAEALRKHEFLSVKLRTGATSVRDYTGASPLPRTPPMWRVVEGANVALAAWPAPGDGIVPDDGLSPSFEVRGDVLRPRVRTEAGDGSLGLFRPRQDLTLRPGEPFDRGDGVVVVSRGNQFPFLAIDIPPGVTVRIDAGQQPVQLQACGSVRIAGELVLVATPHRWQSRAAAVPVSDLANQVPVAVVAAGDIDVAGRITASVVASEDATNLLLACAGSLDLRPRAELPFQTVLAVESGQPEGGNAIRGMRGQSVLVLASFTYGLAERAEFEVRGLLPWRQLPWDRDAAALQAVDADSSIQCSWQTVPADPIRRGEPDLTVGRRSRLQGVTPGEGIAFAAGSFVRLQLVARVRSGEPLPNLRELRLCDR